VGTLKQIGIGKMDGNGPMNPKSTWSDSGK
jgi:hypothetical protein